MTNFDWQTEEDDWNDDPIEIEATNKRIGLRFLMLFGLIALTIGVGTFIYLQLQTTVDEAVINTEEEVIASKLLLFNAAENNDFSFLLSFLSGSNEEWSVVYQKLALEGKLFDLSRFGLDREPGEPQVVAVELSPDLASAEITTTLSYAFDIGSGLQETVPIQRTTVYRKGENHWLFAPPTIDYWGEEIEQKKPWGTVTYPARDEEIVNEISNNVMLALSQFCALDLEGCSIEATLHFTTDPDLLLTRQYNQSLNPRLVILPTPSLLGVPTTQAGHEAYIAGYGREISKLLLSPSDSSDVMRPQIFVDTLVEMILIDNGLVSGNFSAEQYQTASDLINYNFLEEKYDFPANYSDAEFDALLIWFDFIFEQYPNTSKWVALHILNGEQASVYEIWQITIISFGADIDPNGITEEMINQFQTRMSLRISQSSNFD